MPIQYTGHPSSSSEKVSRPARPVKRRACSNRVPRHHPDWLVLAAGEAAEPERTRRPYWSLDDSGNVVFGLLLRTAPNDLLRSIFGEEL